MNNEFGKDMNDGPSKSKNGRRREMERVMDQAQNFRRSQLDGIVSKGKHSIKHQSVKFVLARIEYESVKSSRVLNITRNARFSSRTDFAISVWRKDRSLRIALRRTSNVLKLDVVSNITL